MFNAGLMKYSHLNACPVQAKEINIDRTSDFGVTDASALDCFCLPTKCNLMAVFINLGICET